jgi:beta-lactamase regulating signal transducer with metallopeptidase domain
MPVSDIVLLLGAIGVLITTITTAILTLRRVDTVKERVEKVKEDVQGVHKIVNQQRTDMLAYQDKLVMAIRAGGMHVPVDDSIKDK